MILARALFWLVLGLVLLAPTGCRCSSEVALARLIERQGVVDRDFARRLAQWKSAEPGATFAMGDGIRSGKDGRALLELDGGGKLTLTPESLVRFLPNASGETLALDVEVGEAVLETGREALRISSRFGGVVIDPMSQVALQRSDRGLRFKVAVGRINFDDAAGKPTSISAGAKLEVGVGGVVLERGIAAAQPSASSSVEARASNAAIPESTGPIVARTSGDGVSHRAPGGDWRPLAPGESSLVPGTGLRVARASGVELERGSQRASLGAGEFVVGLSGGALVQAVRGPVRLSTRGASLQVPGGLIIARDDETSADIETNVEQGTRVNVNLGRVEIQARSSAELRGGESALLRADGTLDVGGRGPELAHLVVNAGDSFTVHDPHPPTVVGFRPVGSCPQGAVVTLGKQRYAPGKATINIPLKPGRHAYELRCLSRDGPGESVASGVVTVVDDAGTRTLPKSAPGTQVNTDGRRYTVLYQNLLPKITVGWATAPPAPAYTLVVQGATSRTIKTSSPSYSFSAGALPEGTSTVYFEAATSPSRRSRPTTIAIVFDNATPTASIEGPIDLERGSSASLAGTTMPGWTVSVADREVPVDGTRRFRTDVQVPADGTPLPIVFKHPTRGVHYYLRRSK